MTKRRVVVTGLGMISPLGASLTKSWEGIIAGKSGIRPITEFDTSKFPVKFAGTVPDFDPLQFFAAKELKKMDISLQYGIAAAVEAFEHSGLQVRKDQAGRVGVAVGSGIGGLTAIQETSRNYLQSGPRKISPFFIPSAIINMISGHIALRYGLKGPNIAIATACTTGTHNIGYAARTIQYGDADVMIAGGAEKSSCELGIGGFAASRALSRRNDDPEKASRPWDRDRDGFVLGDGAGAMVLEEYEHAKARGATIYAELAGFGMSEDAYHITLPDGIGAATAMTNAFKDAGVTPSEVDYINAHGTSTPAGDVVESKAIEDAMQDAAQTVSVSSTKSMVGHSLGAAGALEAIYCILAIRDQIVPPTINLDNPDEGCNLDYVPHKAKHRQVKVAVSNSFGFGGTNGTVLFKQCD